MDSKPPEPRASTFWWRWAYLVTGAVCVVVAAMGFVGWL